MTCFDFSCGGYAKKEEKKNVQYAEKMESD